VKRPHCTCYPPCSTRALKRAAHGTPKEFERACARAIDMITYDEFIAAVERYEDEYFAAPEGDWEAKP
jgi:hypothetical protein